MARFITLTTLNRRQGQYVPFKVGNTHLGTMTINSSTAMHEIELPEEVYLQHSKGIAMLALTPGLGVHILRFRDDAPKIPPEGSKPLPNAVNEFLAGYMLATRGGYPLTDSEITKAGRAAAIADGADIPLEKPIPKTTEAKASEAVSLEEPAAPVVVSPSSGNGADALPPLEEWPYNDLRAECQRLELPYVGKKHAELVAAIRTKSQSVTA